jgi:hypothetical protein
METLYYIVIDDEKRGPFVTDELLDEGLRADTFVWYKGCAGWVHAEQVPELAGLLHEKRMARRMLRKQRRKLSKLPEPGALQWLSRFALLAHVPGSVLYLAGTSSLIASVVLWCIPADGPRAGSALERATNITGLCGLVSIGLSTPLLLIEMVLVGFFVWQCRRIVQVLSPDNPLDRSPMFELMDDQPMILPVVISVLLFFAVYIILVSAMHQLTYGLNRVLEEQRLPIARLPVTLSFWTAIASLLLILGPFSAPLFALLPVWLYKTTNVATEILVERREAVEGPPVPDAIALG